MLCVFPGLGFGWDSVRFLAYTPTIFVFPLFAFSFVSRIISFFFDMGVMGKNSRYLTSPDNLVFLYVGTSWASIAQWLLASLCGLYCVHGLRVSSLWHIARCQGQLVTRTGGNGGIFSIPLFPLSFFVIFIILSIWPFGFICLLAWLGQPFFI